MPIPRPLHLPAAAALALAACSRGGGGDKTPPVLVVAAFVGPGAVPAAGDTLRLLCDESVSLAPNTLLTDADFALPAGSTLGAVTAAPVQLGNRVIGVVLGDGVSLAPGVATLAFAPGNDCVRDAAGNRGRGGEPVTVSKGDGDQPVIGVFTLSGVDGLTNGQGPAPGLLQVPEQGFTIDLAYTDGTAGVLAAGNEVSLDAAVVAGGATLAPGTNLVPRLTVLAATGSGASYLVPPDVLFPPGDRTFTALVRDASGMVSEPRTFPARITPLDDAIRPFETRVNPGQVWYLDLGRDLESYTLSNTSGDRYTLAVSNGPNGRPDLFDLFPLVGLHGGSSTINDAVTAAFKARILAELAQFYGGVNVNFVFTAPGVFPAGQTAVPYDSLGFSQICIAGRPSEAGVLGLAQFDPNNATQNDDCAPDNLGRRTGVFVATMIDNPGGINGPSTTTFRQTFDPLRAEIAGGIRIGDHPDGLDAQRVAGTTAGARTTAIHNAINRLARFVALVTAHEAGHSMGLVKNGAMPLGLYGGDAINFPGSSGTHIKMPASLFPAGSVNIMSPAVNLDLALGTATGFNSLNLAYLRERVLYDR